MADDGSEPGTIRNDEVRDRLAALTPAQRALLERKLEEKRRAAVGDQHIAKRNDAEAAPLSFAQQRLWFLDQFEPGNNLYNIPLALQLEGALDIGALRGALSEVVRRHETLRTSFVANNGEPLQVIHPATEVPLPVSDLSELPQAEGNDEAAKLQREEAEAGFDLTKGPLIRARLLRLTELSHVLLITMHHIISDGWSIGILLREIGVHYRDRHAGRPASLPDLSPQYADFAIWQRRSLQGRKLEKHLEYWREQLADSPPLLGLLGDRPRLSVQTFRGARISRELSRSLYDALQQLARRERATLFMALLAAFQILLHRYTRSDDIIVGSPTAGRTNAEIEHLIGFFVNTLALRTDLSGNPTFRQLLGRVRDVALGAYAHQDLPFEKLVEELNPERSLSYAPLFQVMFALQNTWRGTLEIPGLQINPLPLVAKNAKFDLGLSIVESAGSAHVSLEYNTDLFDATTITRLLAHYETLLHGITANPELHLSDLPLLTEPERRQLLVDWNDTQSVYPQQSTVTRLFETQVGKTPDAIAVLFRNEALSYAELNAKANRLAHHLISLGVGPDVLVALCIERSLEMVISLLAILKAGGAYVPLDPAYPKERLAFMLEDSQARILITQSKLEGELPEHAAHCLFIDRAEAFDRYPVANLEAAVGPNHLAYVIYTSGSTGKPKGVAVPHRGLTNLLCAMRDETAIAGHDALLAVTTLAFDIAALELYLPLISGARLILASREDTADGARLGELLRDSAATVMQATPATWRLMIESGWQGSARLKLLCGGEALSPQLADSLLVRSLSLTNLYGPTETTVWSTTHRVAPGRRAIAIGRPIANTRTYILDPHLNPVPVGVPGELHIGGAGLARGYLNRPETTAERFIPNPFSDEPGARLYKTGDLARYLPGGTIEFLGRIDHQVKIRGFRIEPGEIEATLCQHPTVDEAVVIVREDTPGDKRLTAYLVAKSGVRAGPETEPQTADLQGELRSLVKQKLPDYMLPSAFVMLDKLPLTPNGKLDRKALPAPGDFRLELYVAPRTANEEKLAKIFARVLKIDRVGIHDNFFDLGGHSLLVVRLIAEIENAFGQRFSVATVFQSPTVARIGALAQTGEATDQWEMLVPINPDGDTPPLFTAFVGLATELRIFGRELGPAQRFYGISAQCCDPKRVPLTTIEELAACYLKEVRMLQPHGPYYLSGECIGGVVALEMAQQLRVCGERVAMLVLLDAPPPPVMLQVEQRRWPPFKRRLRIFARLTIVQKLARSRMFLISRARNDGQKIAIRVCQRFGLSMPYPLWFRYVLDIHISARKKYVPRAYPDKVSFIWATAGAGPGRLARYEQAWRSLVPNSEHHPLAVDHGTMFREHEANLVAEQMKIYLAEARAAQARPAADSPAERESMHLQAQVMAPAA